MLFLGTKKYPNEAEYKQFLKDHGGSSNASTGMHDTCYQFDVGSDYLEEAVDRLSVFEIGTVFECKDRLYILKIIIYIDLLSFLLIHYSQNQQLTVN